MNFKHYYKSLLASLVLALAAHRVNAQWVTQSFKLTNGWNAVFLHVDASYTNLDGLVGGDPANPIMEIWRWSPTLRTPAQTNSEAPAASAEWISWVRANNSSSIQGGVGGSTLQNLVGDSAYLVHMGSNLSNYTWTVKGRPTPPRHTWTVSGVNLIGFPTVTNSPPTFAAFSAQSSAMAGASPTVYAYVGGDLGANNPKQVTTYYPATTPVTRGQAYWVSYNSVFSSYFGPFEVANTPSAGIDFSTGLSQSVFRLNNLSTNTLVITAALSASESSPPGQTSFVGVPPLLIKGQLNLTNMTYGYSTLSTASNVTWTLAPYGQPGASLNVTLGLDRSAMTNQQGTVLGGIITFTDSLGFLQIPLPVAATAGSLGGLWVGQASVTQVGEYLKTYAPATNWSGIASSVTNFGLPLPNSEQAGALWSITQTNTVFPLVFNPSFEANSFGAAPGYAGGASITGWVSGGSFGLNGYTNAGVAVLNFADNGKTPDGSQVAFIQANTNLSQTITNFIVGATYQVHYYENSRSSLAYALQVATSGWKVKVVPANIAVVDLATAESVLANPSLQSSVYVTNSRVINYVGFGGGAGNFPNDASFPGLNGAVVDFVVEATGQISIPTTGNWSFGVNSDDGFRLVLGGFSSQFDGGRAASDTIATFTNITAGTYPVRLVYCQRGSGAAVEVYAALGNYATFAATNSWALVGDTTHGGLSIMPPYDPAYAMNTVLVGNPAGSGQTVVSNHVVATVGGTNPYYEVYSSPFVATNSTLTLSFVKGPPPLDYTPVTVYPQGTLASSLAAITPYPYTGGWQYNSASGTWQQFGQTNLAAAAITNASLQGTPIGTPGSWANNPAWTIASAFDGNTNTFFSGPDAIGDWVGLDFGVGASNRITAVSYMPRITLSGLAYRMVGGIFQAANLPDFSDATNMLVVAATPPEVGTNSMAAVSLPIGYRYARFLSATNGYGELSELQFYGSPILTNYDSYLTSMMITNVKSGRIQVSLTHRYNFATNDSGQLQFSTNGSVFYPVPAAAFSASGYNGTNSASLNSALRGQAAWTNYSGTPVSATTAPAYVTSVCNLGFFNSGDTVQIRLHAASDFAGAGPYLPNWEVSSLVVTNTAYPGQDTALLLDNVGIVGVSSGSYNYSAVACSADGSRIIAADRGFCTAGGQIYVSQDYGVTWISVATNSPSGTVTNQPWSSLACSGEGRVILASANNGPLYLSTDYGSHWAPTALDYGSNTWVKVCVSGDGTRLAAAYSPGKILLSGNSGQTWTSAQPTGSAAENWGALAQTSNGSNLVAITILGRVMASTDSGKTWFFRTANSLAYSDVAMDKTGSNLVASVTGGAVQVSKDFGVTWQPTTFTLAGGAVASSADGIHLVAAASGSQLFTSDDGGVTWTNRGVTNAWSDAACSTDGTRLVAVAGSTGAAGNSIAALTRQFTTYSLDSASGLVVLPSGAYVSSVNTNLGAVPTAYPLRFIFHNPTNGGPAVLLQSVFVGLDPATNTILGNRETLLHPSYLAQARCIAAAHLPWSASNVPWSLSGPLALNTSLTTTVTTDYNDGANNPFVHTYHPDHDNLDASFKAMQPRGAESYTLQRQFTFTIQPPGTDFDSRVRGRTALSGIYQEVCTVLGSGSNQRSFQAQGVFSLNRISDIAILKLAP